MFQLIWAYAGVTLWVVVPDGVFENFAARREKFGKVVVDEFVAMLLVTLVRLRVSHPEFSDVVEQRGEV